MCYVNTSPRTAPFGTCPLNFNTYADHGLCTNDASGNTLSRLFHLFEESVREISSRLSRCPPPSVAQANWINHCLCPELRRSNFTTTQGWNRKSGLYSPPRPASAPMIQRSPQLRRVQPFISSSRSRQPRTPTLASVFRVRSDTPAFRRPVRLQALPSLGEYQTNGNQYVLTAVKLPLV